MNPDPFNPEDPSDPGPVDGLLCLAIFLAFVLTLILAVQKCGH